jgi:hypothetical protein
MKELIDRVATQAELTPEQSQKAVETVAEYLKTKTPHFFHDQLTILMNGGTMSDGVKKKMSELKDELEDAAKSFGQKAEELASDVGKKINEVFNKK